MTKIFKTFVYFIALILGISSGAIYLIYSTLPLTEELIIGEETFYSYNEKNEISTIKLSGNAGEFSIHFIELGNKYTGDCTYIKYKDEDVDIDILIDCGSKSNSVSAVSEYLNNYVTDGVLDYVIITHAHQDHYAGFATSSSVTNIFDLYVCKTIIDFGSASNQKDSATTYNRYINNRNKEIATNTANGIESEHIPAIECRDFNNNTNRIFTIDEENSVKFEILYNEFTKYDRNNATATANYKAPSENDYSVCSLFSYGEKHFLFTGDLEHEGEELLLENNTIPQNISLYKAGHHGSKTSSSAELLTHINPEYICVCCCAGSSEYTKTIDNQFPTQEFISRIVEFTDTDNVFVTTMCVDYKNNEYTSMNGNIVIWTDNTRNNVNINCSNNTTKLKDTEWFNKTITDENNKTGPNRQWKPISQLIARQ